MTSRLTGSLCAAVLLAGTAGAFAQTATVVVPARQQVVVTPAQGVLVQRYVVSQSPAVVVSSGPAPMVGATMPETVQLQTFDTTHDYGGFNASAYRYVVLQDQGTVLVEPETRRIIQVIR